MTLYAAYRGGLHVVDPDAPRSGRRLAGHEVNCVAGSSDASDRIFAGTFGDGLFRSPDGGDTFDRIGFDGESDEIHPDVPRSITAVSVSVHDPDEVWVGTEPSRVYRSIDGGNSFERLGGLTDVPSASEWSFPPRPDTHHVRWIESCPADPDRWYVGIEAGALVVTPDGGETWVDRPEGSRRDVHTLATHPDAPDRVYAAAGDGYAESDDRGRTWVSPMAGLDHGYVWGLAVDPGDPGIVLVSAASSANAAHGHGEAYLYRKRGGSPPASAGGRADADPTWVRLDGNGIPTGEGTYRAILASCSDDGVWVLHNHGLYRTTDAGETFERVPVDLPSSLPRALVAV